MQHVLAKHDSWEGRRQRVTAPFLREPACTAHALPLMLPMACLCLRRSG